MSVDSQTSEWTKSKMHLLLVSDLLNFNLCCLLVTQYLQNGKFIYLSPRSNFCSERIFKPSSDIWPSLRCNIIANFSPFNATHVSTSYNVFLLIMNRLALIFSLFINISTLLTIFMITFSTWVLQQRLSICPNDNRFLYVNNIV